MGDDIVPTAAGTEGCRVLVVDEEPVRVELLLAQRRLTCPRRTGRLVGWGHARPGRIRDRLGAVLRLRPRRVRCRGCLVTHVLLPDVALPRRADASRVVGAGLEIAAGGLGHRQIAAVLGLPVDTVRGWVRRFTQRAETVRSLFTAVLVALADDPVLPSLARTTVADAVSVVVAAAGAARLRWDRDSMSTWRFACRVSRGGHLAPQVSVSGITASPILHLGQDRQ